MNKIIKKIKKLDSIRKVLVVFITILFLSVFNYSSEYSLNYTVKSGDNLWNILEKEVFFDKNITKLSIEHLEKNYDNCILNLKEKSNLFSCDSIGVEKMKKNPLDKIKRINHIEPGDKITIENGFITIKSEMFNSFRIFENNKTTLLPDINGKLNNSHFLQVYASNIIYILLYILLLYIILRKEKISKKAFLKSLIISFLITFFTLIFFLEIPLFRNLIGRTYSVGFYSNILLFKDFVLFGIFWFLVNLFISSLITGKNFKNLNLFELITYSLWLFFYLIILLLIIFSIITFIYNNIILSYNNIILSYNIWLSIVFLLLTILFTLLFLLIKSDFKKLINFIKNISKTKKVIFLIILFTILSISFILNSSIGIYDNFISELFIIFNILLIPYLYFILTLYYLFFRKEKLIDFRLKSIKKIFSSKNKNIILLISSLILLIIIFVFYTNIYNYVRY